MALTDGEREVLAEAERDARETEEDGDRVPCDTCQGSGFADPYAVYMGGYSFPCPDCEGQGLSQGV